MNIEALTSWSPPREVQTKYGPRILRKAEPDETFWSVWRQHSGELKSLGLSLTKDLRSGNWQVCWWSNLDQNTQEDRQKNQEASRAATSNFDPPCPEGLRFYPFQRAGIAFLCSQFGIDLSNPHWHNGDHAKRNLSTDETAISKTANRIAEWGTNRTQQGQSENETDRERSGMEEASQRGNQSSYEQAGHQDQTSNGFDGKSCELQRRERSTSRAGSGGNGIQTETDRLYSGICDQNKGTQYESEVSPKLQGRLRESGSESGCGNGRTKTPQQSSESVRSEKDNGSKSSRLEGREGGVLIADEPGLGKTIQAIGLINCDESIKRVLVVTKASLKENWKREISKWSIRKFRIGIATGQYFPKEADCVVINYDVLSKHYHSLRPEQPWDLVILDESAAIKNRDAKRTRAVLGSVPSKKKQAEGEKVVPPIPARRRLCLSGTPIENRPEELWTSLNYLDPVRWPNFWSYARRYCGMRDNGWGVDTSGATNLDELQRILRSTLMIRRKKADVLTELPPKTRIVIELETEGLEDVIAEDEACYRKCESTLEQAQAEIELAKCSDSEDEFKERVKQLQGAQFAFSEMARIRHQTAVAKVPQMIEAIREDLEELGQGKIIVFGHHRDVLTPIAAAFPSVMITGETPPEDRQGICDQFQTDPAIKVFVGSIRACGEGLTLTAAKLVTFAEQDWTPGRTSQAEDRAHRIGQRDNVLVKHYVLPGTIDAKMIKTVVEKQEVIDKALDQDPGDWANAPVFTKHEPLAKKKEIQEEALLMTSDQIRAVHSGLQMLAGVCDGAFTLDGQGFNKVDSHIGKSLAESPFLSQKQAALGRRLCIKYRRQLGSAIIEAMGKPQPKETK